MDKVLFTETRREKEPKASEIKRWLQVELSGSWGAIAKPKRVC